MLSVEGQILLQEPTLNTEELLGNRIGTRRLTVTTWKNRL
jgi:hypothetical protein